MQTNTARRDPARIKQAIECLHHARRLLRKAGCKRAAQRVRGALKSAEGAHRHAENLKNRADITMAMEFELKMLNAMCPPSQHPINPLITDVMSLEGRWAEEAAADLRAAGAS